MRYNLFNKRYFYSSYLGTLKWAGIVQSEMDVFTALSCSKTNIFGKPHCNEKCQEYCPLQEPIQDLFGRSDQIWQKCSKTNIFFETQLIIFQTPLQDTEPLLETIYCLNQFSNLRLYKVKPRQNVLYVLGYFLDRHSLLKVLFLNNGKKDVFTMRNQRRNNNCAVRDCSSIINGWLLKIIGCKCTKSICSQLTFLTLSEALISC